MREKGIVIAIDGPAGAGKSTTARFVAKKLGYVYLDTGAMYRAVGLVALQAGESPDDADAVTQRAQSLDIGFDAQNGALLLNGDNVSEAIRTSEVAQAASRVAVHQGVRDVLVASQQAIGRAGGIVLEGRDTGTAIFPDAELKVFLVADPKERARRRLKDLEDRGESSDFEALLEEIRIRDERDRQTQLRFGPWPSPDAEEVDTTGLSIEGQVDHIVALAKARDGV